MYIKWKLICKCACIYKYISSFYKKTKCFLTTHIWQESSIFVSCYPTFPFFVWLPLTLSVLRVRSSHAATCNEVKQRECRVLKWRCHASIGDVSVEKTLFVVSWWACSRTTPPLEHKGLYIASIIPARFMMITGTSNYRDQ